MGVIPWPCRPGWHTKHFYIVYLKALPICGPKKGPYKANIWSITTPWSNTLWHNVPGRLDIIWLKCGTFNKNYCNKSTAYCFFLQTLMRWPLHTRGVNIPFHVHTESIIIKKGPHHNTRTNSMPTSSRTMCPSTTIQVNRPTTDASTQMKWKVVKRF